MSATTPREPRTSRATRKWPRILVIALVAPVIAVGVLFFGPFIALAVIAVSVVVDWAFGRKRRAEFRAQARSRRRELLEQAIANGGPSDEPAVGRGKVDVAGVRREFSGPKRLRYLYGWPRGHI